MTLNKHWNSFRSAHWSSLQLGIIGLLAVLLPFCLAAISHPQSLLLRLLFAIVILFGWLLVFCHRQPAEYLNHSTQLLLQACLFTLLMPISTSYWLFFITISFGTVFGERVFGGRGYSFINPVVAGLSFQLFSSAIVLEEIPVNSVPMVSLIPALLALILFELVSWRTLAAVTIGIAATTLVAGTNNLQLLLESTAIGFALLFLAGDPANGGSSNSARWMHGVLCGGLLILLVEQFNQLFSATIFAIFLASLSAPLLDTVVARFYLMRMRRRYD